MPQHAKASSYSGNVQLHSPGVKSLPTSATIFLCLPAPWLSTTPPTVSPSSKSTANSNSSPQLATARCSFAAARRNSPFKAAVCYSVHVLSPWWLINCFNGRLSLLCWGQNFAEKFSFPITACNSFSVRGSCTPSSFYSAFFPS